MQTENVVRASDSSAIGTIANLGPLGLPFMQTNGPELRSLRSHNGNDTRTSMFNGRPVSESPILDAKECLLLRSTGSTSPRDSLPKENANIIAKTQILPIRIDEKDDIDTSTIDECPLTNFEQNSKKHKTETKKKEGVGRGRTRIGESFLQRNPSQKVPRFVPNGMYLI